ncbi:MAG TPA: serine protease [Anaeromyxobacteraceae bacterium]|nr:serine protease [Anaeromyxobacteraceae bacterium]
MPCLRLATLAALVPLAAAGRSAGAGAGATGQSAGAPSPPAAPSPAPICTGEYADFLSAMSAATRAFEASPRAAYTYCLRTTAVYEHVAYGRDGELKRRWVRHVRHGTAFAYQVRGSEVYLATNEHVVEHPAVTESDGQIEGVPAGARKVRETVRIVASEADEDDPGRPALEPVLADEALDLAILKTRQPLQVMPYRLGRSAALRVGNAVQVRGYPLGAFAAANTGRVIGVAQPDRERGWSHEDFAIDAPLNAGNSGSPVFAVSCRTGELELVGIYHAGYKDAQALNVVVSVDQLREALVELRVPRRDPGPRPDRESLVAAVRAAPTPFLMPFGDRTVRVEADAAGVRFALLDREWPLTSSTAVTVAAAGDLSRPAALLLAPQPEPAACGAVDEALRDPVQRLYDALFRQLAAVLAVRDLEERAAGADGRARLATASAAVRARRGEQRELLEAVDFQAEEVALRPRAPAGPPAGSLPASVPSSAMRDR